MMAWGTSPLRKSSLCCTGILRGLMCMPMLVLTFASVTCQLHRKEKPTRAPMVPMPVLSVPFEVVAIDLVGPFPRSRKGFKYLLTAICLASRYPEAELLRTVEAAEVVEKLVEILSWHGWPRQILSDQGSQFTGSLMKGLCARTGIETVQTTPFHPQTNGVVERFHGTLVPMLRKAVDKQIDWPLHLPLCFILLGLHPTGPRASLHLSCCWGGMLIRRWTSSVWSWTMRGRNQCVCRSGWPR